MNKGLLIFGNLLLVILNLALGVWNYTRYLENGSGFTLFTAIFSGFAAMFILGIIFKIATD